MDRNYRRGRRASARIMRAGSRERSVAGLVSEIRNRWRRSVIVKGLALTLMVALLLFTVLLLVATTVEIQRLHFNLAAVVAGVLVLGVLYAFVFRPLRRQPSDAQLAMFVEERVPELQDRLNSAVEVSPVAGSATADSLFDRLVRDAVEHAREIQPTTVVDQRRERAFGVVAGVLFCAFLVFGYQVRDKIQITRAGVNVVGVSFAEPAVSVYPGTVEIEKGAPQEFIVRLRDDRGETVTLLTRSGEAEWQSHEMVRGIDESPTFLYEMPDVQQPVEYFVQYGDERTDVYNITLYEFPSVGQIDVSYRYPEYTGLGTSREENGGDLEAVVGTRATVEITAGGQPVSGSLVLHDGSKRELAVREADDGGLVFAGSVEIRNDGSYHVELVDGAGKENRFPVEYAIIALPDREPIVNITEPRRDVRANAIQEVLIAAEAHDDFGTATLRLHYSVNADEERVVDLAPGQGVGELDASGEHLLFLEDYALEPGDVISYYASATDRRPGGELTATDMYFIEVIPFDQQFTQVNNQGGLGGSQQGGIVLSQQEIIAATWRLQREQPGMSRNEVTEMLDGIIQAQQNLEANIEQRISSTAFSRELMQDDESRQVVQHLRDAVEEMNNAVEVLRSRDLRRALTPERKALNHLLKANALNTEQQVAMQRGAQGSGGGGGVQERISELMDLELDISKDKYETQQQRSQQQQQQDADDALSKIKELARRQQDLAQQGRQQQQDGEDRKRFIDRLKREQDELRRQTEELTQALTQSTSRSDSESGGQASQSGSQSRQSQQAREASRRVADEMEKAEEALRRGDVEEAMAHQQRALNELQRLQRDMQVSATDDARQRVSGLGQDFDELRAAEEKLGEDLRAETQRMREEGNNPARGANREALESLREQREANIERLDDLASAVEGLESDIRGESPAVASALRNMLQRMRREELDQNMENSGEALRQGWLDYAERTQREIQDTIERMEAQRRALDESLPPNEEERVARSLRDTRDLQEALEAVQREARELARLQQGQGADPTGQNGRQSGDGQAGGDGDRAARTSQARMDREMQRAREALERLREGTQGDSAARAQLDRLSSFLTRADGTGVLLEGEAAAAFFNKEAYDPLSQLEMNLARQLDEIELEKKLYGTRQADVPPEYRRMVDDYYEALSKDDN